MIDRKCPTCGKGAYGDCKYTGSYNFEIEDNFLSSEELKELEKFVKRIQGNK